MTDQPVLVGVDGSPEAAKAAKLGVRLADAMNVGCHLVHAESDSWSTASDEVSFDLIGYNQEVYEANRESILPTLCDLPQSVQDGLEMRPGRPDRVLKQAVVDTNARLVVLGGKQQAAQNRWLRCSSVHQVARGLDVPLLVTGPESIDFTRILAAVDLSYAAIPTLATAEEFADICDKQLWVLHAIQTAGLAHSGMGEVDRQELVARETRRVEAEVWPMIERPNTEKIFRCGDVIEAIGQETAAWGSALVVVGSHAMGRTERLLLGSTTERLLTSLPASILVVPVRRA